MAARAVPPVFLRTHLEAAGVASAAVARRASAGALGLALAGVAQAFSVRDEVEVAAAGVVVALSEGVREGTRLPASVLATSRDRCKCPRDATQAHGLGQAIYDVGVALPANGAHSDSACIVRAPTAVRVQKGALLVVSCRDT